MLSDDLTWKKLCEKHSYRRLSSSTLLGAASSALDGTSSSSDGFFNPTSPVFPKEPSPFASVANSGFTSEITPQYGPQGRQRRPKATSYKSHFKQRYMVETAWRSGGKAIARHITPDQGVVTSLHLTPDYIVIALDNAKIHVFDADGQILRTLTGHVMGVWAMVPWGNTLVSGGCDRDVRVWDMETGYASLFLCFALAAKAGMLNVRGIASAKAYCAATRRQCVVSR